MSLPKNIAKIKIHPAIGFARLSKNRDFRIFGEPTQDYKSNQLIKRQSVQYRLFAFDKDGHGLEELTEEKLAEYGVKVIWRAQVANRKISRRRGDSYLIEARSSSEVNDGQLEGRCGDFEEGQNIQLGQLNAQGLFIPPLATVHKEKASDELPAGGMHTQKVTDNTSDGIISAELVDIDSKVPSSIPVLDAWIVVAPPDFAPEVNDVESNNLDYALREEILLLPGQPAATPVNQSARDLDKAVLTTGTAVFSPGIEMVEPEPEMFYQESVTQDPDEIRVRPKTSATGPGVFPGDLTFRLCSPWQFDFRACSCYFWPNHRPDVAFKDSETGPEVNWRRRAAKDSADYSGATAGSPDPGALSTNSDFVNHVDELGIVTKPGDKLVEVERDNDI